MSISLNIPENVILTPKITVFGVGGAGGNAVNNMIVSDLQGADFIVANTDAQAIENAKAPNKLQLGENITRGLGAGACPEVGKAAAEESSEMIEQLLEGSNMVFITAGMGGGTGTGAAPVVAKLARSKGILTVGVVTKPFHFEGAHRMRLAEAGLKELQKYVDTLIVIPNQNLFRIANERTTFADAFKMADDVLHAGVRGVTDLITMPGLINLDFADIVTIMSKMGKAMMGTGEASGENRAILAAEAAISNPLLDHTSMRGARGVLINITGGPDLTLFEVDEAANRIRDEVDSDANIIFGSTFNPNLEGKMRITVVATGIDAAHEDLYSTATYSSNNVNAAESKNSTEATQETVINTTASITIEQQIQTSHLGENVQDAFPQEESFQANKTSIENQVDKIIERAQVELEEEVRELEEELVAATSSFSPRTRQSNVDYNHISTSTPNYVADNYAHKKGVTASEMSKPHTEKNTKGLFSRFFGSNQQQKSSNVEQRSEDNFIDENDIEIPAFLRRKK